MKLPNADRAVVDVAKLREYCLNPEHHRGRHKARLFAAVLGVTAEDADFLRNAPLAAARTREAEARHRDRCGQRYVLDFELAAATGRRARIRSGWIVRIGEEFPRLTSCYVIR
jgi:hypothetical protein